jgi:hypothetical protein
MNAPLPKSSDTIPVRLPDEFARSLRVHASMRGITPAQAMQEAWDAWWARHGDRVVDEAVETLEAMRPAVSAPATPKEQGDHR